MAEPLGTKPVEGAERRRRANVRLAIILASIAATFFAGVIVARYVGGMEFGMSFVGVIIHCVYFSRQRATSRVWEGARGLEWTLPSPAPYHSYTEPPVLDSMSLAHGDVTH